MFRNQSSKIQKDVQDPSKISQSAPNSGAFTSLFDHIGSIDPKSIRESILRTSRSSEKIGDLSSTVSEIISNSRWLQVKGMSRFWTCDGFPNLITATTDAVSGIHAIYAQDTKKHRYIFLMLSVNSQLNLYYGSQVIGASSNIESAGVLSGCLPGITFSNNQVDGISLQKKITDIGLLKSIGCLIGVPKGTDIYNASSADFDVASSSNTYSSIDRVVRGMGHLDWGYVVYAEPLERQFVENRLTEYANYHTQVSSIRRMNGQINRNPINQTSYDDKTHTSYNESKTISQEIENHEAKQLSDLLNFEVSRVERGLSIGIWQVQTYFFSANVENTQRLGGLLCSSFRSSYVRSEPVQFKISKITNEVTISASRLGTTLVSDELATLSGVPSQEFSGYPLHDYVQFDSDTTHQNAVEANDKLELGQILSENRTAIGELSISRQHITKHVLVAGVTGSGKTTSIFNILNQISTKAPTVPFLVIEPAKTEYRRLLQLDALKSKLVIYTPGKENCNPFRINPFEFDVIYRDSQRQATLVQTHIDFLKSIFNAAFILYAPMPYVLDMALHEIYQDKGWDIAIGSNKRLFRDIDTTKTPVPERSYPVFPTLTDLRNKVVEVVAKLGYEHRIQMDVIAGLQARIDSLRLGAKGLMLDISHGIGLDELVNQPTVIELESLGNDDEKSFLMGIIMARLYEYQRLRGYSTQLRHVTVIEEAHRLLKNVNTDVGTEEANNKALAVGVFVNMLSEVRAYGEGLIIAEQIPSKLAPDVIKNTNLKLLHRMVAKDDRDIIGASINLSEQQSINVLTLSPKTNGVIAFSEGDDRPYLLKVHSLSGVPEIPPTDHFVRETLQSKLNHKIYEQAPGLTDLLENKSNIAKVRGDILVIGGEISLQRSLLKTIYTIVETGLNDKVIDEIRRSIVITRGFSTESPLVDAEIGGVVRATYFLVQQIAKLQALSYTVSDAIYSKFSALITQAICARAKNNSSLTPDIQKLSGKFGQMFITALKTPVGPYSGCDLCKYRCHYRIVALDGLDERTIVSIDRIIERKSTYKDMDEYWQAIAEKLKMVAETYQNTLTGIQNLRLCMAVVYANRKQLPEQSQIEFVKLVSVSR